MQELLSRCESVRAVIAKDGMYAENARAIFCAKWLNFWEAAGRSIGMSLFRASCPPPFGPAELFKIAPGNFVFSPLFLDKQKKGLARGHDQTTGLEKYSACETRT